MPVLLQDTYGTSTKKGCQTGYSRDKILFFVKEISQDIEKGSTEPFSIRTKEGPYMKRNILLCTILFIGFGCKQDGTNDKKSKEIDYDAMSVAVCNCYVNSGLDELNNQLSQLQDRDAPHDEMKKLTESAEQHYVRMKNCIDSVELKFGRFDKNEHVEKAEAAMKKNCPQLAPFFDELK
jgi:CRISPR/Cas system CMR-associated protein Cmr5 small subunit